MKIQGLDNYTVTKVKSNSLCAYEVRGPRSSEYFLCRNKVNPDLLFSINGKGLNRSPKIHGYTWFKESGEVLVPVQ